jgi:uncharacterized protein (UPF0332 family)
MRNRRHAPSKQLAKLAQVKKKQFSEYIYAEWLVETTGYSISELQGKVTTDRMKLASKFCSEAKMLLEEQHFRIAVGRGYYSMYHAFRAVSFFEYGGDDFEPHSVLPEKLPSDFPSLPTWQDRLKNARLTRNNADYDPYPLEQKYFADSAHEIVSNANVALRVTRIYLRSKGLALK